MPNLTWTETQVSRTVNGYLMTKKINLLFVKLKLKRAMLLRWEGAGDQCTWPDKWKTNIMGMLVDNNTEAVFLQ